MKHWLRLAFEPNIGPVTARRLLDLFKTPEAIFSSNATQLAPIIGNTLAAQLSAPASSSINANIEQNLMWQSNINCHIITLDHPIYPNHLKATHDPPIVLFAQGQLNALEYPPIAIVGARHASPQGLENAYGFASHLSQQGFSIISGLAHGIDAAAHQGAIDAQGVTLAVMGTGMDVIYPREHRHLASQIAETGLLLSEFPLGTRSQGFNFPRRNRVVAGMSVGVLVVEAALKSGSLITARYALEMGREVFAIPGSIHSPLSKGGHHLIKQGAALIEDVADICAALGIQQSPVDTQPQTDTHPLLSLIGFDPIRLEEVLLLSQLTIAELQMILFELEMSGEIARLPGGMIQRKVSL